MTNILQIPESLQFYFENAQQTGAIQQILEMESLPLGLTWEEVENYQMAKISAQTTQFDYWRLMKELWDVSWGKVEEKFQEISPKDYDGEYSMEYAWENSFYKAFHYKGDSILFLFSVSSEAEGSRLGFYIRSPNDTYEMLNGFGLSQDWVEEDYECWTRTGLIEISGKTEIDTEPLIKLAKEVIDQL
jgi:hypothetical protein